MVFPITSIVYANLRFSKWHRNSLEFILGELAGSRKQLLIDDSKTILSFSLASSFMNRL
jgi:hypothetical protein